MIYKVFKVSPDIFYAVLTLLARNPQKMLTNALKK